VEQLTTNPIYPGEAMQQIVYERAKSLMEAELGDELVALDPAGGECFGFNDVATAIWRLLETPRSFADLTRSLIAEYDVEPAQCEADVEDLLAVLVKRGLICSRSTEH
jgi:hypothetical protein